MRKAIVLVAAFVGFSMTTHWMARAQSSENQTAATQVIEVSAKKYEFTPGEIHVKKGVKVELKVHSEDDTHGVKLDAYPEGTKDKSKPGLLFDPPNENGKVTKGVDQGVDFVAQEAGTYDFKCAKVCGLGHDRMKGKVIVEE
jgi:cytochrome c oxidase subunit 2